MEFVGGAVDAGMRCLCLNDFVDTAEEGWEEKLHEAQRHHAQSNRFLSKRIKRAQDARWAGKAAMGPLRPGYLRRSSIPAMATQRQRGPFYDEIDPQWTESIRTTFERVAANEDPAAIAEWLTSTGLPKSKNATKPAWSALNVISLIRNPVYRGEERFRQTFSKKHYGSGRREQQKNHPDDVLIRSMPHLRIVPDWLWYAANDAINARVNRDGVANGHDHKLSGIARDSRGPLSLIFLCRGLHRMHLSSTYCCSLHTKGGCWNKATVKQEVAHKAVADAVCSALERIKSTVDELRAEVISLLDDGGRSAARRSRLQTDRTEHVRARERLASAVESSDEPPDILVERLKEREEAIARCDAELEHLDSDSRGLAVPSAAKLCAHIDDMVGRVQTMDRHSRADLQLLVGQICVFPFQQFGGNKVVLRARCTLIPAAILPPRVRLFLTRFDSAELPDVLRPVPLEFDLFKRSSSPDHWRAVLDLREKNLSLRAIGQKLGISKRQADLAFAYGQAMIAAGHSDPFIELTEAPENASRWRKRKWRYSPKPLPEPPDSSPDGERRVNSA